MKREKTFFVCNSCGSQHPKWVGQCVYCKEWNTVSEEKIYVNNANKDSLKQSTYSEISSIPEISENRFSSNDTNFDIVLGGGIVAGSVTLLGGDPGVGKSTLMLQIAVSIKKDVLYVSGEESLSQIKLRYERLKVDKNKNCYISTDSSTTSILNNVKKLKSDLVIIDSIQTVKSNFTDSAPGTVIQIKESATEFIEYAKKNSIAFIIIGHVTKEGIIAGPKILEHMVDTVLHFEGDRNQSYRVLRAQKNRFGSTMELTIYQMTKQKMLQVMDFSNILTLNKNNGLSGSSIAVNLEGTRSFMVEVQALVSTAVFGVPQRVANGVDNKRLNMLLAVIEKKMDIRLSNKDIFINITGGIRINDPAIDLAIISSVISSHKDLAISNKFCFSAEVGLSGELRPVLSIEKRIIEAQKLGYENIFISKYNKLNKEKFSIQVTSVNKIKDIIDNIF